jgi:sugar phosphate isomerase/epimerase
VRRFSVNQLTTPRWTFDRDVDFFAATGVPAIGVSLAKVEGYGVGPALRLLRESGLPVSCVTDTEPFTLGDEDSEQEMVERTRRNLELAAEMEADCLTLLPGSSTSLSWEEAATRSRPLMQSLLASADAANVRLCLQPTSRERYDLSFLHSLDEAMDFVAEIRSPRLGVVFSLSQVWTERRLYRNLRYRTELIALVVLNDSRVGENGTPEHVVLGDGNVPIRRICQALGEAGYRGWYDIRLDGVAIETEGYESVVRRSVARFLRLSS